MELLESEQLFSDIFYKSPVAISITERGSGKIVDANETFLRDLEFSREEVIGKSIIELGLFYDPSFREKLIDTLIREGGVSGFECPFKTKSGKIMHGIMSMSFILYKGSPHQLTTVIDITGRKLAELKISESERLLNESQRVSKIGSYTLDIVSGLWNGSIYLNEMFGVAPSTPHSVEDWMMVIHPDDKEMMANYFIKEVVGQKHRFDKEYRIINHIDQKETWVHGYGELEFDRDGNPIKMIGTIQNITERKKADEELRKLSQAIEQSPDSILITDTNGQIEYVNPSFLHLSGYTGEELIGKNQQLFSTNQMSLEEYAKLWETISSGSVWHGEFMNRKKTGELYWQSASISPIHDSSGVITHYLLISEDISEQKKLTNELIKAKEKAEESDRLKSSFLANMSHEIRTPMNSIMGFASLLPEEDSRELMIQYANIIVQNSEQLVSLIDGIVMYSKLQTGLFAYRPSVFEIKKLLSDIQLSFNLPIYQKEVLLTFECNENGASQMTTDYDKLRQILVNLITNAFKYTPQGEITTGCIHNEDAFVFYVKDTGIGIPTKDIDHIFDRFYRGSNINEAQMRGTGLGLCIVKGLVEMIGGKIWVESEIRKGSTFFIEIPR
jgi:PAS domain S-box-containing protein